MHNKSIFVFVLILSLLTGCATTNSYTCNPNTPQATLGILNFNMFTNNINIIEIFKDPYQCKYPQHFSLSCGGYKPRLINANQLTTFSVMYMPFVPVLAIASPVLASTCMRVIYTSFIPKSGHYYFITGINHSHKGYSDDQLSLVISDRITVCHNGQYSYVYKTVPSIKRDCRATSMTDITCFDSDKVKNNLDKLLVN